LLELLQPLWLFALTGITIPVIVHFWNQRPGKTLKVGSTALVIENATEYRRSVKLSDIVLLLVRCVLIAVLAGALSNPVWKRPLALSRQKGWIVIPPQHLNEIYLHFKTEIDSLKNAGFEFHYFKENFQTESIEKAVSTAYDTTNSKSYSYWTLLTLLDEIVPRHIPVYLFTDNYLEHFSGKRPSLEASIYWSTFSPTYSTTQQVQEQVHDSLNCIIYTDHYTNDAYYIKAAIDAIKSYSKKNINCAIITNPQEIAVYPDWIFWLSDEQPPVNLRAKNMLTYKKGKARAISSMIDIREIAASPVRLYKSISFDNTDHPVDERWTDGFGNPILTKEEKDSMNYYSLFTHFDPSWNELVWNDNFPALLYKLISNDNIVMKADYRTIDQQQLLPNTVQHIEKKQDRNTFEEINLAGFSWLLLLLLFFGERLLSFQNVKLKTNG
jgi:hypothetical protein